MESNYFFIKSYEIPLFKGKLVVILTNDNSQLSKRGLPLAKLDPPLAYAAEGGSYKGFVAEVVVINIEHEEFTNSVIAHEALHATNSTLRRVGIDREHEETQAYLIEWVFGKIEHTINLYKKK